MEMVFFIILQLLVLASNASPYGLSRPAYNTPHLYNVMDFGAAGVANYDDTKAMVDAWRAACGRGGPATIVVPKGKTITLNTIDFDGRGCKFSSVHFRIEGQIAAPQTKDWAKCRPKWMYFLYINGLTIDGNGVINGNGGTYWSSFTPGSGGDDNDDGTYGNGCRLAPSAVEIENCNNVKLNYLNSKNSPGIHFHIKGCTYVHISNVHITAPGNSPNTDGINVRRSQRVIIKDSVIGTGDDCIAINDGSKVFNISNIACGPGHGISVGSLGKDGSTETVEDIYVRDSSFTGTMNGARIKTWTGGSGHARRITYDGITLNNVKNPIIINQKYCDYGCPGQKRRTSVDISHITFKNFHGTSANDEAIQFICSAGRGCTNINTNNVKIQASNPRQVLKAVCENAHGKQTITSPRVPCLTPA